MILSDSDNIELIQQQKKHLRADIKEHGLPVFSAGKQAELLRRQQFYRESSLVFVDLSPALQQIRINCLLDGKDLVVPSPGLKDGFFLFKPFAVPFKDLSFAMSIKGLGRYGNRLNEAQLRKMRFSLFVTDALAVDRDGGRLGDGLGFFDLSHAILHTLGTAEDALVATCVNAQHLVESKIPTACWDVSADYIVTDSDAHAVSDAQQNAGSIYWGYLSDRQIRKITPLWWIRKGQRPED